MAEDNKPAENMFISWGGNDIEATETAIASYTEGLNKINPVVARAANYGGYKYRDIEPNVSVRSGFSRDDYELFRPDESLPHGVKAAIAACMRVYKRVGVIRNTIDLMGDFGCQGIEIVHPDAKKNIIAKHWFNKINGQERSERFLNLLYRTGTVIVQRKLAKLAKKQRGVKFQTAVGKEAKVPVSKVPNQYEIPWNYKFINPLTVEVEEGSLAPLLGKYTLYVQLPHTVKTKLDAYKGQLPPDLVDKLKGDRIYLDMEKVRIFSYKKDDWDIFALPMVYPILDDIQLLEKMRLADLAALDGVISNVRIWKLGSIEGKLAPTPAAFSKLAEALMNVGNGNTADLIWGPDLQFEQHIPDVSKVLGSEKYVSVMNAIFGGLGIPPTLTGTADKGGFTNNYISMKTLIERLQYGRTLLENFWHEELRLFQLAMGWKEPPTVRFSMMNLADPVAEKALLIQLADRDLISIQTLQERFGEDPDIEAARQRKENRDRESGQLPDKSGPWNDPQLDDKHKFKMQEMENGVGVPSPGRPKNSKDSVKRKTKTQDIRTSASMVVWANNAQDKIDDIINPIFLESIKKQNLRQITKDEEKSLNNIKFSILCSQSPFTVISKHSILSSLKSELKLPQGVCNYYESLKKTISNPTYSDLKQLRSFSYVDYNSEKDQNNG